MTEPTSNTTHPGLLFIVAAPSGAGKTSLVKALLESSPGITVSVSHTTRPMRPGEENGVHYHFIDIPAFEAMRDGGEFLEFAKVFDNYYGTSKAALQSRLDQGLDVILEIDWQGARQVRKVFPHSIGIFILPPSRAALRQRLQGRGQDDEQIIARRMRDAEAEMSHYDEFEYLIFNDDFDQALHELRCIVQVQHLQGERQQQTHAELLQALFQP